MRSLLVAVMFVSLLSGPAWSQAGVDLSGANSATNLPVAAKPPNARIAGGNATTEVEYRIGSQDLLEISVYGLPEFGRTVRVNSQGKITLPLIGLVDAVGMSAQRLERLIADRLSENFLQNPQVSVFIKEFTTLRFTVEGAVNKPGVYPLVGQMTLLRALAVAGGQGSLSDMSEVMLFRVLPDTKRTTLIFDAEEIRSGKSEDPLILNDDLLVVKRSKARTAMKDSLFRDILDVLNPIPLFLR